MTYWILRISGVAAGAVAGLFVKGHIARTVFPLIYHDTPVYTVAELWRMRFCAELAFLIMLAFLGYLVGDLVGKFWARTAHKGAGRRLSTSRGAIGDNVDEAVL